MNLKVSSFPDSLPQLLDCLQEVNTILSGDRKLHDGLIPCLRSSLSALSNQLLTLATYVGSCNWEQSLLLAGRVKDLSSLLIDCSVMNLPNLLLSAGEIIDDVGLLVESHLCMELTLEYDETSHLTDLVDLVPWWDQSSLLDTEIPVSGVNAEIMMPVMVHEVDEEKFSGDNHINKQINEIITNVVYNVAGPQSLSPASADLDGSGDSGVDSNATASSVRAEVTGDHKIKSTHNYLTCCSTYTDVYLCLNLWCSSLENRSQTTEGCQINVFVFDPGGCDGVNAVFYLPNNRYPGTRRPVPSNQAVLVRPQ